MKKLAAGFTFFENTSCAYYPCHKGLEHINCLFCYCPLYPYRNCGGSYTLTEKGIKNCTDCIKPHIPENYSQIIKDLRRLTVPLKEQDTST